MLKGLSNNKAKDIPILQVLIAMALFLSGCSTLSGMTPTDKFYQDKGYILHCTEVAGDECLTHQWFNTTQNTYRRY